MATNILLVIGIGMITTTVILGLLALVKLIEVKRRGFPLVPFGYYWHFRPHYLYIYKFRFFKKNESVAWMAKSGSGYYTSFEANSEERPDGDASVQEIAHFIVSELKAQKKS